jgi:hypothetical protein
VLFFPSIACIVTVLTVSPGIRPGVLRASALMLTLILVQASAWPSVPAGVLPVSAMQAFPYALSYSYTLGPGFRYSYIRGLELAL